MKGLKKQMKDGTVSNWFLGRAEAFRLVANYYPKDASLWRELMRSNAQKAIGSARLRVKWGIQ